MNLEMFFLENCEKFFVSGGWWILVVQIEENKKHSQNDVTFFNVLKVVNFLLGKTSPSRQDKKTLLLFTIFLVR